MRSRFHASSFFLDLLFPPVCLSCNAFGEVFCSACQKSIVSNSSYICPSCLKENKTGGKHSDCNGFIDGLTSCWSYEGVIQKAVKAIKYQYYYSSVETIVNLYCQNNLLKEQTAFQSYLKSKPIIVPVPLYKKRQETRGFNQSAYIGRNLARYWHLPFSEKLIQRHQNTRPQAELKKHERQENIKKAFSPSNEIKKLGEKPLINQNILLVDDVWTTGSTMQSCAGILKQIGAEKVWAITLAR